MTARQIPKQGSWLMRSKKSFDGWTAGALIMLAIFAATPLDLVSETITLSTTYPSPVGIYHRLITTGSQGSPAGDTYLNRDGGNLILAANNPFSFVGIGTDQPHVKLDVRGLIQVGTDSISPCSVSLKGAFRWFVKPGDTNDNTFQVCDGTAWTGIQRFTLTPSGNCSTPGQTQNSTYYQCSCGSSGSLVWQGTVTYTCTTNSDGTSTWKQTSVNCPPPTGYSC